MAEKYSCIQLHGAYRTVAYGRVLACMTYRSTSVRGLPLCLLVRQRDVLGEGKFSWMDGETKPTHHDTEETFCLNSPLIVFVDLYDLLSSCADRNEKPPRLGQLVDQLLWYFRGSCSNVDAIVRTASSMACGWR